MIESAPDPWKQPRRRRRSSAPPPMVIEHDLVDALGRPVEPPRAEPTEHEQAA